jgi:hypothetical protein
MRSVATALAYVLVLACVAANAAAAQPAAGQPAMTAADLAQLCAGLDHVSRNACRVYILGVTQGIAVGLELAGGRSAHRRPCLPAGVSAETLEQTVKARLASLGTSAQGERDAASFIGAAVAAAFPCKSAPAGE